MGGPGGAGGPHVVGEPHAEPVGVEGAPGPTRVHAEIGHGHGPPIRRPPRHVRNLTKENIKTQYVERR